MSNGVAGVVPFGNEGISFIFGGLISIKCSGVFGGGGCLCPARAAGDRFFSSLIAVPLLPGHYHSWSFAFSARRAAGGSEDLAYRVRYRPRRTSSLVRPKRRWWCVLISPPRPARSCLRSWSAALASVAGSVLAGYAQMGVPLRYLIAASFMAYRVELLFAKIIDAETEKPDDNPALTARARMRINRPTCWTPPPPAPRLVCSWRSTSAQCLWRLLR